jgi:hypothetical protein
MQIDAITSKKVLIGPYLRYSSMYCSPSVMCAASFLYVLRSLLQITGCKPGLGI